MTELYLTKQEFDRLFKIASTGVAGGIFFILCSIAVYFTRFLELNYKVFILFYLGLSLSVSLISLICVFAVLYNRWAAEQLKNFTKGGF